MTNTYYRALAEGDIQHYKVELSLLRSIASRSRWDAYVTSEIASTQGLLASGKDRTPPDFSSFVPDASAIAAAIIFVTMIVWLGLGLAPPRLRAAPSPAGTPPPATGTPYPSTP